MFAYLISFFLWTISVMIEPTEQVLVADGFLGFLMVDLWNQACSSCFSRSMFVEEAASLNYENE